MITPKLTKILLRKIKKLKKQDIKKKKGKAKEKEERD